MTYTFIQKNGSAIITLSANNEEDAFKELAEIVAYSELDGFRLEEVDDDDYVTKHNEAPYGD